jgi:DNA processing protein
LKPEINEQEYWLALMRAPGLGPVKFMQLVKHFGNPREVFEADQAEWEALNLTEELINYLIAPDWKAVEKDQQWLEQPGNYLLIINDPDYPAQLRAIDSPPPILFVCGDCALLSSKQLAIVGTRRPSREGEQTANEFAEYLSHQGITITSGMALGIDGASHWGALAGSGKTIAVAGTGLSRVYPAKHRQLAHQIVQTGAIVSELPPDTPVRSYHFPIRSRIVSGLSLGTLVVEAPVKSGALYTARHAQKQGREVFAIPGSIHNPLTKGCHLLIKEGAKLVETAVDILEELQNSHIYTVQTQIIMPAAPTTAEKTSATITTLDLEPPITPTLTAHSEPVPAPKGGTPDLNDNYARLLEYLALGPTSIDDLVEHSQLTASEISSMLLILELDGQVTVQVGGLYERIR